MKLQSSYFSFYTKCGHVRFAIFNLKQVICIIPYAVMISVHFIVSTVSVPHYDALSYHHCYPRIPKAIFQQNHKYPGDASLHKHPDSPVTQEY